MISLSLGVYTVQREKGSSRSESKPKMKDLIFITNNSSQNNVQKITAHKTIISQTQPRLISIMWAPNWVYDVAVLQNDPGEGQVGVKSTMQIPVIRLRNKISIHFMKGKAFCTIHPPRQGEQELWSQIIAMETSDWLTLLFLSFCWRCWGPLGRPRLTHEEVNNAHAQVFMLWHVQSPFVWSCLPHGSTWKYYRRAMRIIDIRMWVVDNISWTLDISLWFVHRRSFIRRL